MFHRYCLNHFTFMCGFIYILINTFTYIGCLKEAKFFSLKIVLVASSQYYLFNNNNLCEVKLNSCLVTLVGKPKQNNIKLYVKLNNIFTEMYKLLKQVQNDAYLLCIKVYNLFRRFREFALKCSTTKTIILSVFIAKKLKLYRISGIRKFLFYTKNLLNN